MPLSNVQRQAKHRAKRKAEGVTRMTISLDEDTPAALRDIAATHGVSQAKVLQVGILAARQELDRREQPHSPSAPATARTILVTKPGTSTTRPPSRPPKSSIVKMPRHGGAPTAEAPSRVGEPDGGEPWWPKNHRQLLEDAGDE